MGSARLDLLAGAIEAPDRAARRHWRLRTIPGLLARRIVRQILIQTLVIVFIVEGIFGAEKLGTILESGVDRQAGPFEMVTLVLCVLPEIFDLALPLAVLVASYRVLLRCREDRELLALAATGIGSGQGMLLVSVIGVGAFAVSLYVGGFVAPLAHFAYRKTVYEIQTKVLRGEISSAKFYALNNSVLYAWAPHEAGGERHLFIDTKNPDGTTRVIVANHASVVEPHDRQVTLKLRDFEMLDIDEGRGKGAQSAVDPPSWKLVNRMRVGSYDGEVMIDDLVHFNPRGEVPAELISPELLSPPSAGAPVALRKELGDRVLRLLLCLFAPLFALFAVAITVRQTRVFALPVACALLMSTNVFGLILSDWLAPVSLPVHLLGLAAGALLVLAGLAAGIRSCENAIVRPAL
jgi:lipopolysaccharide export LptBFGC system permease protein LptF